MSDWNESCEAELTGVLYSLLNPLALGRNIANPNARDPHVEIVPTQVSLEIFSGTEWVEHKNFVVPGSIRGKERAGYELSFLNFGLWDVYDISALPFSPPVTRGQRVRLRNETKNAWYFKGSVQDPPVRVPFSQAVTTPRDLAQYNVTCVNEMGLFSRVPVKVVLEGPMTECEMLANLCGRYVPELDASGINLELGAIVDRRAIDGPPLYQIFKEVERLNPELTFFLDISQEPTKIYFDRRASLAALLPTAITDTNLYNYCKPGDFNVRPSSRQERNRVIYRCPRLWNMGTVDVDEDNFVVYGTGTNFVGNISPGSKFRRQGSESTYNVDKVKLAGEIYVGGTQGYQEETETGVPYEIESSDLVEEVAEDTLEIERKKAVTGEVGDDAGVRSIVIEDRTPLTIAEHLRMAETCLYLQGWDGIFRFNNTALPFKEIRAGQTIDFNCPLRDVTGQLPIQEVDWRITEGWLPPRSGRVDPPIDWVLDFQNREMYTEGMIRQILLNQRRGRIRDVAKVTVHRGLAERYAVGSCVAATYGEELSHSVSWSSSDDFDYVDESTLTATRYPRDLDSGQLPLDPAGDEPESIWYPS